MNRLAHETSPYLLQHARNPVDWYPWGPEALERAKREDRPILLSIGYAACHWCHVMEHESFEHPGIARLMNDHFVNIKVDREERPDLDAIYMQAVQAMTGHGGWPMTVFLTPDGVPFYGGTYFPPVDRHGMPAFPRVLETIAHAYHTDRDRVLQAGTQLQEVYSRLEGVTGSGGVTAATLDRAAHGLARQFDGAHGGFGGAPKFPPSMSCEFLLTHWARSGSAGSLDIVRRTFRAMAHGGIHDQVGGGIHRYSVDERWLVPHFEKMLYDNALFIRLGVHLWQGTRDAEVCEVVERAVTWVEREMTSPDGGFWSSLDADSEGHEGRFYVWSAAELDALLGDDAAVVRAAWGVTPGGNFEGANILHLPNAPAAAAAKLGITVEALHDALARARGVLYPARARRVWPGRDDKVLASWNGLMLRALAEVARAFDDPRAAALARRNATFLRDTLLHEGRVRRSTREGKVQPVAFLEDQAAVALGFIELHALDGAREWLDHARTIAERTVRDFRDPDRGLFFDTPVDHEALITRPRDVMDNAMPAGQSLVSEVLLRLAVLDNRPEYEEMGSAVIDGLADAMGQYPNGFGHLLCAADLAVHGAAEVALMTRPGDAAHAPLVRALGESYIPALVLAPLGDGGAGLTAITRGKAAGFAYACRRYACQAPTTDPAKLLGQLAARP